MSVSYASQIIGTGSAFPERVMKNVEFEEFLDTSDEWIRTRTGIEERRIIRPEAGECTVSLAEKAAKLALKKADVKGEAIDLIIVGTTTPDTILPCTANRLQPLLGAKRAFTFDLQAACSGFIYALSVADQYIRLGKVKTALAIGVETLSTVTNWRDRSTCVLFGDGAGAVILTKTEGLDHRVIDTRLYSDGSGGDLLCIPHGVAKVPPSSAAYRHDMHTIKMNGGEVFKFGVRMMVDSCRTIVVENGFRIEDIDLFLFHQANIRIVDKCLEALNVERSRTWLNVNKYGNTSSATLPVCLDEAWEAGAVKKGDLVVMSTVGGGFTWGSALIRL